MKRIIKIASVLFLFTTTILSPISCKKEIWGCGDYIKKHDQSYADSIPEFKLNEAFVKTISGFKTGTYWIYEEKKTLKRDCVYVVSFQRSQRLNTDCPCKLVRYTSETIKISQISTINGYFTDNYSLDQETPYCLAEREFNGALFDLALECCNSRFTTSSYLFNDSVYSDAFRSEIKSCLYKKQTSNNPCDKQNDILLFIKNIGLVYRKTGDGKEVWNLVKYKIVL